MPISLINLRGLFGKTFLIPYYQRGYRWTKRQVEDLLKDILEFQKKLDKKKGEFYCLQPLVVKKIDQNKYEIIDGQQRLTTIHLLLLYFKKRIEEDFKLKKEQWYKLEYQTRKDFESFLNSLANDNKNNNYHKDIHKEQIDYYYLYKAWEIINDWLDKGKEKNYLNTGKYLDTLLAEDIRNGKDLENNIRFIWYEVDENEDGEKIFTRINRGKIPLTSAELIKALFFLKNEKQEEREIHQLKRAYEWELIENKLQDDKFWYFLNSTDNPIFTRIDFIFDLIADKYEDKVSIKIDKSVDKYFAFYIFNEMIINKININEESQEVNSEEDVKEILWQKVKEYYLLFEEWYNDYEYYHLIGYLIHSKRDINQIINLYSDKSKDEFKTKMKQEIMSVIIGKTNSEDISEEKLREKIVNLSYEEDRERITNILLLYNILLTMKTGYVRFPFDLYTKNKWSLEHIHAQNSEDIKTEKHRKQILIEQLNWIWDKDKELLCTILDKLELNSLFDQISSKDEAIKKLNDINLDDNKFKEIEDIIFKNYSDEIDFNNIHSIDNLTLLSVSDNSALKNNIFPIKREKIIEMDVQGHFIPLATKNVFLKYFSTDSDSNIKWTKKDRENYLNHLIVTIKSFFGENEEGVIS